MPLLPQSGKFFVLVRIVIAFLGLVLLVSGKMPWPGRLPGDFYFKGKHVSFYFPLATSLLISLIFTLIFCLIGRK